MSSLRIVLALCAFAVLAIAWGAPFSRLMPGPFSTHMTTHMAVVAVAAPLLALAVARTTMDPAARWPRLFAPVPASIVELIVVWGFHTPALHGFARSSVIGFVVEQSLFLGSGLLLWCAALGHDANRGQARTGSGVLALLLTSMHMTLLGALLALAPRPVFTHGDAHAHGHAHGHEAPSITFLSALSDQHVGGAIMLIVGAVAYLAGGVALSAVFLRQRSLLPFARPAAEEAAKEAT